jgi:hypothetical protein
VKFFQEINMSFRTLTWEEEKRFLASATPYIQDIAVFALNTGLRIGEILSLTWESVDLENNLLSVFAHKTNKIRGVPINTGARRVLEYWALGRKSEFVFYNHETGNPFVDLKVGFALACRKAGIEGVTVAYAAAHVRIPAGGAWRGYSDSSAIARTFDRHCNDALHAYKSRRQEERDAKTRKFWRQFSDTVHQDAAITIKNVTKKPAKC